jgi:hypothetical protein
MNHGLLLTMTEHDTETPWTRRCLAKCVVFKRWACEQTEPGAAEPHPLAKALLLVAADNPVPLTLPGALQIRRFLPAAPAGCYARLYRAYAA